MDRDAGFLPLSRRGWIGDGRSGAVVGDDGTVDWYCPAALGGPPVLWRLLDPAGAAVRVGPRRPSPRPAQSYRTGANVLVTRTAGPGGRQVEVSDMVGDGISRLVRALAGPVDVAIEVASGGRRTHVAEGVVVFGNSAVRCPGASFAPAPRHRDDELWRAVVRLDTGEEAVVSVGPADSGPCPGPYAVNRRLDEAQAATRSWLAGAVVDGPYRASVERALLGLRSLTGADGVALAAGTTSLPRRVGTDRTSDERWVRLRDAARAATVYSSVGLADDTAAAETWLRTALSGADVPWPTWLGPDGQPPDEEEELAWSGWRRSQPVRVGRRLSPPAPGLLGDVLAAVGAVATGPAARPSDQGPLSAAWPALSSMADWVTDHWADNDGGRWDIAFRPRPWAWSRLSAWYGLDRMVRLARAADPLDLTAVPWHRAANDLAAWLEGAAADPEADAALLELAWRGPWPTDHPAVHLAVDRVLERLSHGLLVHRYSDHLPDGHEGPDHPDVESSLMAARALARLGRWEEAHARMEAVVGLLGPLGLAAATADPVSGQVFGNLPHTGAALSLVETAVELARGPR